MCPKRYKDCRALVRATCIRRFSAIKLILKNKKRNQIRTLIIWLQQYVRSDWLLSGHYIFSCNDRALPAWCPRHIQYDSTADRTTENLTLQDMNTTLKEPKTERGCSRRQP